MAIHGSSSLFDRFPVVFAFRKNALESGSWSEKMNHRGRSGTRKSADVWHRPFSWTGGETRVIAEGFLVSLRREFAFLFSIWLVLIR